MSAWLRDSFADQHLSRGGETSTEREPDGGDARALPYNDPDLVYDERAAGLGDTRATESDADVVTEAIAICADATRA